MKSKMRGGEIIGQMLIDAPQIKGEAAAELRDAVNSAVRDATDAVERNQIPRQYEHVLKVYFERLAGLIGEQANADDNADAAEKANPAEETDAGE